jgi:WD40 repeat protein
MTYQTNPPRSRLHQVPARPSHLRGRDPELDQLDKLLAANMTAVAITPALTGQGGIGKTQLAALYAHDRGSRFEGGVFWLMLAVPNRDAIIDQLVTFARACGIVPGETGSEEQQERALVERWLGDYGNRLDVLLVLDNLEQPRLLIEPLPGLPNHRLRDLPCRKLITSRRDDFEGCALLRLETLPVEIARAVLVEAAGRGTEGNPDDGLEQLLRLLGGLPLALRLAGALLAKRPTASYARLAEVLRGRSAREILDATGVGDYRDGLSSSLGAMLAETWSALPPDRPWLGLVVQALAQMEEAQTFPAEVIKILVALPDDPLGIDDDPLPEILRALQSWNLIERPAPDRVRLHPLIQEDSRRRCARDFLPSLIEDTAHRLQDVKTLLTVRADRLAEVARALDPLSKRDGPAANTVAHLCRMLQVEARTLGLVADPVSGSATPANLAYSAALHGCAYLREAAEGILRRGSDPGLAVEWTTILQLAPRHLLQVRSGFVLGCAISADGVTGFSAHSDQALIVWDLATGKQRHRLRGHERRVHACAISADGRTGLSASDDQTLIVWDLASGEQRHLLRGHDGGVRCCAVSADGRTGLSASDDKTLIVWDLSTGRQRHRLHGHERRVHGCAISADGCSGLSTSDDQTLIVWDLAAGQERQRHLRAASGVLSDAISDERTGLLALDDKTLIVWDLSTGRQRHRLDGHEGRVRGCAISADGRTGVSASDRTLIVWDLATGELRCRLRGPAGGSQCCAISADGATGLSASDDGLLIVWDLTASEERRQSGGHPHLVTGCGVSSDGRMGLSVSCETLVTWDLTTGTQQHRRREHNQLITGCAVSGDGHIGLLASVDKTLIVRDLQTGEGRHRLRGHEAWVTGCAVSASGRVGLSASADRTLILWDLSTGRQRHRLHGHDGVVMGCAISPDGSTGLSASADRTLILWDLSTGRQRHRLQGHKGAVRGCAISADGCTGLSAAEDLTLIVWDLATGEERRRLRGHESWVLSCAISADGRTGLSTSRDQTLIVWDLSTDNPIHRLGIDATADAVALAANGRRALVGDRKGNVTCFEIVNR